MAWALGMLSFSVGGYRDVVADALLEAMGEAKTKLTIVSVVESSWRNV
jgi:hypothetical protein